MCSKIKLFALVAVLVATLNVNIGANVVSPSNDFSNLAPRVGFAATLPHHPLFVR